MCKGRLYIHIHVHAHVYKNNIDSLTVGNSITNNTALCLCVCIHNKIHVDTCTREFKTLKQLTDINTWLCLQTLCTWLLIYGVKGQLGRAPKSGLPIWVKQLRLGYTCCSEY